MSIESEKIWAQRMAFHGEPSRYYLRHLIGPVELEQLFRDQKELVELKKINQETCNREMKGINNETNT